MSIGIDVGYSWYQIGRSDYFDSFFSTVAYYLENKKWGSVYPVIMNQMYTGDLSPEYVDKAIEELIDIKNKFSKLTKNGHPIIWDARDLSVETPEWAINPNEEVTTLSNYYIISDGRDLIEILITALRKSKDMNKNLIIKSLDSESTIYS
ncbi:hypothetical protein JZO73_05795 [Enterococcus plantarum]|uniref:Imm70 family immunity protein n=1 Tax=Enterococcus plantarum TaxID=1077675 RepID=UPI001A908153|nr:hypothetical protein [Enterococcus plantarum]